MNRCCSLIPLFVIAILGGCSQGPNGGAAATARPTKESEVIGEKIAVAVNDAERRRRVFDTFHNQGFCCD